MTEYLDGAEGIDIIAASSAEYSTIKKIKSNDEVFGFPCLRLKNGLHWVLKRWEIIFAEIQRRSKEWLLFFCLLDLNGKVVPFFHEIFFFDRKIFLLFD